MYNFHRFLYGTIISSLIIWTIYLLTIDFYSITFVPYQYKHLTHLPFPESWSSLNVLALMNLTTILVIFCSAFFSQVKNIKVVPTPIGALEKTKEEVQV